MLDAHAEWLIKRELRNITGGNWQTEHDAEEALVQFLENTNLFVVYRQVAGEPLWKHHFQEHNAVRADLLLFPSQSLIASGWRSGAVVIEVKRSGEKIGPGLNQLIDYTNSSFYIDGGVAVMPSFGFLFPAPKQAEAVASIMAHQHLGTATLEADTLHLYCGESRILSICADGSMRLGKVQVGRRLGRR